MNTKAKETGTGRGGWGDRQTDRRAKETQKETVWLTKMEKGRKPTKAPAFRNWKGEGHGFFPEPPQGIWLSNQRMSGLPTSIMYSNKFVVEAIQLVQLLFCRKTGECCKLCN